MAIDQNKLNDLFGDDWGKDLEGDFETDDSGETVFGNTDSDDTEDSNDLNEDKSEDTDAEESEESDSEASDGVDDSDSGDSEADPVESRFQSLESSVDKLTGLLEQIAGKLGNQPTQPKEEESDEDDDIPLTRKELRKMMEETVSKAVKPFNQQTQEQKEAQVVNTLLQKYGEDFKSSVPAMKQILAINPEMGIQKAWDIVSSIKGPTKVKPKATTQDSDTKKLAPKKGDAAELRKKAANLNTAKGVSGSGKDKKRAVGIDDIIKQSWEETFE